MTVTLITGANKGLGFETARQLTEAGHTVWAGARSTERGEKAASELGARFVQLDVTDDASVAEAMRTIEQRDGRLDVLVNNAGIAVGGGGVEGVTGAAVLAVFETNTIGVVRVTQAALPLLEKSDHPVVVNVSSSFGSFWAVTNPERPVSCYPNLGYSASKAALNMLTVQYAKALPQIKVQRGRARPHRHRLHPERPAGPEGRKGHRAPSDHRQGRPRRHLPGARGRAALVTPSVR